jgi:hypothetical protein
MGIGWIVGTFGGWIAGSRVTRWKRGWVYFAWVARSLFFYGKFCHHELWARAIAVSFSNAFPSDSFARADNDALRFDTRNNACISKSGQEEGDYGKQTLAPSPAKLERSVRFCMIPLIALATIAYLHLSLLLGSGLSFYIIPHR